MKAKNCKLHQIIGILLCLVLLIGLVPAHIVMADDAAKPQADGLIKYERVTSVADIKGSIVILYKDQSTGTRYALSTGENNTTQIKQDDAGVLLVDPYGDYVLKVTKNDDGTVKLQANDGTYLRMDSSGMFGSGSNVTLTYDDEVGYWSVNKAGGRSLTFSGETFGMTNGSSVAASIEFEIWTEMPPTTDYIKLAYLEQLADFDATLDFIITIDTEEGLKAIGSVSNGTWLHDIDDPKTNDDGIEYITVLDTENVVFNAQAQNDDEETVEHTSGMYNKIKYWGFGEYGIRLKNSNSHYYPQYIETPQKEDGTPKYGYPLRSGDFDSSKKKINYTVRFEYGTGENSDKIYIRGNGGNTYLGYDENGSFIGSLSQDSPNRVPVQIYVAVPEDAVRVEFLDGKGDVQITTYANPVGTLSLTDKVKDVDVDGVKYTFVGWTLTKPETSFLSTDDSANIFDYDNKSEKAHISDSFVEKFRVIGDCNPESSPEESGAYIDLSELKVKANDTVQLYPLYAVKGFDSVVTALEADGTKIIGISDWKADQGADTYYNGGEAERWLGYIDVQMFKDGVEWVAPTRLYYRYHNDNTADLTIKFIWDELVDQYEDGGLDPLYLFMSDQKGKFDQDPYPIYDQSGHFVLDAVYAYQGGSEDGLNYSLNWMTDHGGQLDNVEGGSLVQLFVSTKYDVKYYLDNKEITEASWINDDYYTTPGTSELFNKIAANADYTVRFDNELYGLVDRDFVVDEDPDKEIVYSRDENGEIIYDEKTGEPIIIFNPHEWFIAEDLVKDDEGNVIGVKRGDPEYYSYVMHDYEHVIPLAISPEELVPAGRTLTSKAWSLKDENNEAQSEHDWSSVYALEGNDHGTGNTAPAYIEEVNLDAYEADAPYTFHLHAYTGSITSPDTGDYSQLVLWVILMVASLFGTACLVTIKKKAKSTK